MLGSGQLQTHMSYVKKGEQIMVPSKRYWRRSQCFADCRFLFAVAPPPGPRFAWKKPPAKFLMSHHQIPRESFLEAFNSCKGNILMPTIGVAGK